MFSSVEITPSTRQDKIKQQVEKDLPACLELFSQVEKSGKEFATHMKEIIRNVTEKKKTEGMSFLTLRSQLLLSMLINQTKVLLAKSQGKPVQGDPAIHRLLELRTTMEKIRPLEAKLRYQIDSLVKLAKTGAPDKGDPLMFKPDPDNLMSKVDVSSSEDESEVVKKPKKEEKYRPPKLKAVHYEYETEKEKQVKLKEMARRRALSRNIVKEYTEQFLDAPEEEPMELHPNKRTMDRKMRERLEYEETHFKRLSLTRKEKNEMKRMQSGLEGITNFGDVSALDLGEDDVYQPGPKSKRRRLSQKQGKGRKHRRR